MDGLRLAPCAGPGGAPRPSTRSARPARASGRRMPQRSRSRASSASARLAAMSAGQPPGSRRATQSMAAGSVKAGVGSAVPDPVELETGSARGRCGSRWRRGTRSSGWMRSRRSARTHRKAGTLGRTQPLVAVAGVVRGTERVEIASGTMPGAWAPSTSVSIPRASSSRTSRAIGRTRAVGLVTWLSTASRVRGVTAPCTASTTSSAPLVGNGIGARTTRAPSRFGDRADRVEDGVVLVVGGRAARRPARSGASGARRSRRSSRSGRRPARPGPPRGRRRARRRAVEMSLQLAVQEPDRSALQPVPPLALDGQHRLRTRPERAVVQERDVGSSLQPRSAAHRPRPTSVRRRGP